MSTKVFFISISLLFLFFSGLFLCLNNKAEAKDQKPFMVKIDNTVNEKTDLVLAKLQHLDEKVKRMNRDIDFVIVQKSIPATYRDETFPAIKE